MTVRPTPIAAVLAALFAALANAEPATTLPEITVTASGDAEAERQAAVTQKTVIDRAEIEALGGLTVGEVIRKLPGIEAGAHSGEGGPSANARGMGRDAVQFLVDGERPSANSRYALTTVGRLPAGELERVEILRGASAEHGGSAPVTVNLVMRKARPATSTAIRAAAGLRGDEPNGQFTASLGGGDQAFSWILPLTVNHHAMPLEKTARRQQATGGTRTLWQQERESSPYTLDEFIVSPRLTWRGDDGSLSLWPSLYHNRGERSGDFTRQAYADPVAGSGLSADGRRRDDEQSQLTIARLRAEGERKTGLGKLFGRVAAMGARREQDTVGVNFYLRRTEDFIERRTALEGSRWVDRPDNEGTARHWGLELDAKLKGEAFGWKGASLRSHLTLPKARVDDERLGVTRAARDLPRYQWSLGVDQALAAWQASTGFQLNLYGPTKTDIPGELSSRQKTRSLLDVYIARRLTPQLNLRLEAQNLLAADTRRLADARSGSDSWSLATSERGQRSLLLSLEGKW